MEELIKSILQTLAETYKKLEEIKKAVDTGVLKLF